MEILEEKLYYIKEPSGSYAKIVQIADDYRDIAKHSKYLETVQAMKDQVAVIYQGVLHGNDELKAFGSPDLLIRSDIINFLVDTEVLNKEEILEFAPGLGSDNLHYRVVDIKFCTMKLRSNGKNLCNSGRMVANKGQIIIYNMLLGIAQGYTPKSCYVQGRGWIYQKKGEMYDCLRADERLGDIDTEGVDKYYVEKVYSALDLVELD